MKLNFRIWDVHNNCWLDGHLFDVDCWGNLCRKGSSGTIGGVVIEASAGAKDVFFGKLIYEGDIIKGDLFDRRLPIMGKIVFDEHLQLFASQNDAGNTPLHKVNNVKVIGNVHENPELLPAR